ncbi:MAG TPA: 3-dehydroquinate synthase [Parachlamydiaceae bacterium]|nr:3-dehydroquinate synthase [Parachlamydiaceae bacterium]
MKEIVASLLNFISKEKPIAIISDSAVGKLYGNDLKKELVKAGFKAYLFTFPEGEQYKTRRTKEELEDAMLEKHLSSDAILIAFGGGVVTDLAGFIAATYCRGIPYISIPTTLLAMCDSSIGGKNGVNCKAGKNLIGTFYEPKKIIVNYNFLNSLSPKAIKEGLAEVIKHALIEKPSLFRYLEKNKDAILSLNPKIMESLIKENVRIKQKIVRSSKRTKPVRNLLNFGHTVAHALELESDYTVSHGEAVAFGILIESKIAHLLGFLPKKDLERIQKLLTAYGYRLEFAEIGTKKLLEGMALDKKAVNGQPRFVILNKIGACNPCEGEYCKVVDRGIIEAALQ